MTDAERRQQRIEDGKCGRRRCELPPKDGSEFCDGHHEEQKRRQTASMKTLRATRKRRGLCGCGRPRRGRSRLCAVCLKRLGGLRSGLVNSPVNKASRIAAATVVDKEGRTRYLGRQKRGAPTSGSVDRADLELAATELIAALDGVALYEAAKSQQLPRAQREDLRQAYVARAFAGARAALDVCRRAGWTIPGLEDPADGDAGDIAATGRKDRR
jgi:hypothetical protein